MIGLGLRFRGRVTIIVKFGTYMCRYVKRERLRRWGGGGGVVPEKGEAFLSCPVSFSCLLNTIRFFEMQGIARKLSLC
jgi:hypothetical protein